nr:MAG TPA: hypothetical protein [Caudoviricetes sp.]
MNETAIISNTLILYILLHIYNIQSYYLKVIIRINSYIL